MEESERQKQILSQNGSEKMSRQSSKSNMYNSQIEESKCINDFITNIFDEAIKNFNDEFESRKSSLSLSKDSNKHIEDDQNNEKASNLSMPSDNKAYSSSPNRNVNKLNTVSYDDKHNLNKDDREQSSLQDNRNFNIQQFKTTGEMLPGKIY